MGRRPRTRSTLRFISQSFIHGHNKPSTVALVVPDWAAVRAWAEEQGLDSGASTTSLLDSDKVKALLDAEVASGMAAAKSYERPLAWAFLREPFSTDNDLLTPKLSLKRHNILERYQSHIDSPPTSKSQEGGCLRSGSKKNPTRLTIL